MTDINTPGRWPLGCHLDFVTFGRNSYWVLRLGLILWHGSGPSRNESTPARIESAPLATDRERVAIANDSRYALSKCVWISADGFSLASFGGMIVYRTAGSALAGCFDLRHFRLACGLGFYGYSAYCLPLYHFVFR